MICNQFGINVILTSPDHKTGTDRVGEVAEKIQSDLIVNVQGDEPLLEPSTIKAAITPFVNDEQLQVSNLMTKIKKPVDVVNFTVPKVITNNDGIGVFITRSCAPYPKGVISYSYFFVINS